MKYLFSTFALIALLCISGCSTTYRAHTKNLIYHLEGLNHQDLINELGAPTRVVSDGGDGLILVYEGNRKLFEYSNRYASNTGILPTAEFYLDRYGICRKITTSNTENVRAYSPGKTLGLLYLLNPKGF